jgi:hypothetical protein
MNTEKLKRLCESIESLESIDLTTDYDPDLIKGGIKFSIQTSDTCGKIIKLNSTEGISKSEMIEHFITDLYKSINPVLKKYIDLYEKEIKKQINN